jgi:membrane protein YdbS with pleckstrin-like domain
MQNMTEEYQTEWEDLRKLRRWIVKLALAAVAVMALVPLSQVLPKVWSIPLGLALFSAFMVVIVLFFVAANQYKHWSCPRCGRPFHFKYGKLYRLVNPFARHCIHCGLPKWSDIDPDPNLKHQLDPFRTDKTLGLEDIPRS